MEQSFFCGESGLSQRGATVGEWSAHEDVRELFFKAKALPVTERAAFLQQHPITHRDDFFALGATILDMYAECGWRRGQSVADLLTSAGDVNQLVQDVKLRLEMPNAMIKVLQACLGGDEALTVDSIVELTGKLVTTATSSPVVRAEDMTAAQSASIRNNLGVALYDSGMGKQKQGN